MKKVVANMLLELAKASASSKNEPEILYSSQSKVKSVEDHGDWKRFVQETGIDKQQFYHHSLKKYKEGKRPLYPNSKQKISDDKLNYLNIPTLSKYKSNESYYNLELEILNYKDNSENTNDLNKILSNKYPEVPIESIIKCLIKHTIGNLKEINIKKGRTCKSLLYLAAENNAGDAIRAMIDAGVDFSTDTGHVIFGDDGTTKKETVSSLFIVAQYNAGNAMQAMRDAGVDFKKDTGRIIFGDDGTTKSTQSQIYLLRLNIMLAMPYEH